MQLDSDLKLSVLPYLETRMAKAKFTAMALIGKCWEWVKCRVGWDPLKCEHFNK